MIVVGNKQLLNEKLAVILNSSQSKTPCGNDAWVRQTRTALSELAGLGYTMITSTGLVTWELVTYLTGATRASQVIVSQLFDDKGGEQIFERTISDFELDERKAAMVFIKSEHKGRSPKVDWLKRDRAAMALAQKVAPISIRPGGRLQALLESDVDAGKVDNDYKIIYQKPLITPPRYDLHKTISKAFDWNHVAHWTKTRHGPWLGEKRFKYYERLIGSCDQYPNNALSTLMNIVKEKRIRASTHKMRGNQAAIGFSESPPEEVLNYLRWRPKMVNWNFEPYGVVLHKDLARGLGIKPVVYGAESDFERLPESERPYFHGLGEKDVDWSHEKEWRHLDDLDLSNTAEEEVSYFVWRQDEVSILRALTGSQVFALSGV